MDHFGNVCICVCLCGNDDDNDYDVHKGIFDRSRLHVGALCFLHRHNDNGRPQCSWKIRVDGAFQVVIPILRFVSEELPRRGLVARMISLGEYGTAEQDSQASLV